MKYFLVCCWLVVAGPATLWAGPSDSGNGSSASPASLECLDDFLDLSQPYITNISAYNPIYFLFGTDPAKSKFQISLKYRLFEGVRGQHHWQNGIHLGYTQTSFWDLRDKSLPFKDTSYKPEIFFQTRNQAAINLLGANGVFLKMGLRHESNGRDGISSRSTNTLYLQPYVIYFNHSGGYGIRLAPLFWVYVANDGDTNADLPDYRGYFKLQLKTGWADGLVLEADLGLAKEGGSYQVDLTYPLRSRYLRVYFHVEYANALAESLINYRQRTEALRIGFNFVR